MHRTATACDDPKRGEGDEWFVRDEHCRVIHDLEKDTSNIQPNHIVFTVLIPHKGLDMSRWHQFLVGVMSFEVDVSNVPRKYCITVFQCFLHALNCMFIPISKRLICFHLISFVCACVCVMCVFVVLLLD
jgi:hypothetical protein